MTPSKAAVRSGGGANDDEAGPSVTPRVTRTTAKRAAADGTTAYPAKRTTRQTRGAPPSPTDSDKEKTVTENTNDTDKTEEDDVEVTTAKAKASRRVKATAPPKPKTAPKTTTPKTAPKTMNEILQTHLDAQAGSLRFKSDLERLMLATLSAAPDLLKIWPGENAVTGPSLYGGAPDFINLTLYELWKVNYAANHDKPVPKETLNDAFFPEFATNLLVKSDGSLVLNSSQHVGLELFATVDSTIKVDLQDTDDWWFVVDFVLNVAYKVKLRTPKQVEEWVLSKPEDRTPGAVLHEEEVRQLVENGVHEPFDQDALTNTEALIKEIWDFARGRKS